MRPKALDRGEVRMDPYVLDRSGEGRLVRRFTNGKTRCREHQRGGCHRHYQEQRFQC
jgi:hypothetical protein